MHATLIVKDEINVRFRGLDEGTLEKAKQRLTFYVPGFKFMPKFKLKRWDGTISLFKKTGVTWLHLLDEVLPVLEAQGYDDIDVEDHRRDYSHITNQLVHVSDDFFGDIELEGQPLRLRDYQIAAVNTAIENGVGLLEMATGSGKTLVCATLSRVYAPHGRVVVIVPTIDLIVQTQSKFRQAGIDPGIWYGPVKDRKDITIATWQSLDHFPELFEGVVCVIVDEVHQAKAPVLSEMLSGPAKDVPFRFGCTGTLPKEDIFRYEIRANLGPRIFHLETWELQDQGVLAEATVYQLEFQDMANPRYVTYRKTFEDWADQINFLMSDPKRLDHLAALIVDVTERSGNTLVLVPYRKHGKALQERIPGSLSLDGRDKDRMVQYQEFNAADGKVMICTYGIASEGLDLPRIFTMVCIEAGKKFEKVIQSMGRGLRKKAGEKEHLVLLDVASDDGISAGHAKKRKKLFIEAKQDFERIKVAYA